MELSHGGPQAGRVVSLDVMRGLIMLLLAAEACGVYEALAHVFTSGPAHALVGQFFHHEWHGLLAWDLVQPGFMLIAGTSLYLSWSRKSRQGVGWSTHLRSVAWRSLKLFACGVALHCVYSGQLVWELWNVLTQLAATTLIAYLIIRWPARWQLLFSVGLLVLTECLYRFVTAPGFEQPFVKGENFGAYFDHLIMGKHNSGGWAAINFIPTAAHTIWGVLAGKLIASSQPAAAQIRKLVWVALAGLLVGYLLDLAAVTPIIKRISTSSFVLVSGGYILLLMAFLRWLVDVRGCDRYAWVLVVIGMNPIFIYLFFESVGKQWFNGIVDIFVGGGLELLAAPSGSIPVAVAFVTLLLEWLLCYWLYQRRIFFKL